MGVGGDKGEMREISETRAATRDAQFEAFVQRILDAGGAISEDQTVPLYTEVGMQELEVGEERIVQFSLPNGLDFKAIRKKETHLLQGSGHQKSLQPLDIPRVTIILYRKPQSSQDWQVVDLEEMF